MYPNLFIFIYFVVTCLLLIKEIIHKSPFLNVQSDQRKLNHHKITQMNNGSKKNSENISENTGQIFCLYRPNIGLHSLSYSRAFKSATDNIRHNLTSL